MFIILRRRISSHIVIQTQFLRPISTTTTTPQNPSDQSSFFTVSYLVNSCGLSPELALSASKKVQFKSPSKPDLVLQFLRNHEFAGQRRKVAATIKGSSSSWVLQFNLQRLIGHKVESLRKLGVSEGSIAKLVKVRTQSLCKNNDRFDEMVRNVIEMGIDTSSAQFANALHIFSGMNDSTLESKRQMFRSCGWSEDEIVLAIRKQPVCISISKEKLKNGLDFFMNELKWKQSELVKYPNLLGLCLEKRIFPRWLVIQRLLSKGLVKDAVNICSVLKMTETEFLQKFLVKYGNEALEILKLYQGKL
ncbi:hypothetical protein Syun_014469 [Stephania yunnanensis]|uniref:Uncharacterized protein n=1 Tax=Stephania yunnanensis TaxID=152371 RepID=A0AAP0JJT8_9MAGN